MGNNRSAENYRIIILDDEVLSAMGLQADLQSAGVPEVYIATNYETAIEIYRKHAPNCAIVDINLQAAKSGIDFIRDATAIPTIVILSGYSESQYREELAHISYTRFLEKPIDVDVVLDLLR